MGDLTPPSTPEAGPLLGGVENPLFEPRDLSLEFIIETVKNPNITVPALAELIQREYPHNGQTKIGTLIEHLEGQEPINTKAIAKLRKVAILLLIITSREYIEKVPNVSGEYITLPATKESLLQEMYAIMREFDSYGEREITKHDEAQLVDKIIEVTGNIVDPNFGYRGGGRKYKRKSKKSRKSRKSRKSWSSRKIKKNNKSRRVKSVNNKYKKSKHNKTHTRKKYKGGAGDGIAGVSETEECSVCMEELLIPPQSIFDCDHTFCISCLEQWTIRNGRGVTCPICRSPLNDDKYNSVRDSVFNQEVNLSPLPLVVIPPYVNNMINDNQDEILIGLTCSALSVISGVVLNTYTRNELLTDPGAWAYVGLFIFGPAIMISHFTQLWQRGGSNGGSGSSNTDSPLYFECPSVLDFIKIAQANPYEFAKFQNDPCHIWLSFPRDKFTPEMVQEIYVKLNKFNKA